LELFVQCLWNILISHGVPRHPKNIHIFFVRQNIGVHALVVNQMKFQAVADFQLLFGFLTQGIDNFGRFF
jgi:hypothetical protein